MTRLFDEQYRTKSTDTVDATHFDARFKSIDLRMHALEELVVSYEAEVERLKTLNIELVRNAIGESLATVEEQTKLIGLLVFPVTSQSHEMQQGEHVFNIPSADLAKIGEATFATLIPQSTPAYRMTGVVTDIDVDNAQITVLITDVSGIGVFESWFIGFGFLAAGREGVNHRGDYDGGATYFKNDAVFLAADGASYVALLDDPGPLPGSGWRYLARGATGLTGDAPAHEWSGTQLRFANPDGSWGAYTDLVSDIDQTALDSKADSARLVSTGTGLTGGGSLTADRTISADIASQAEAEAGTATDKLMTPERVQNAIDALVSGAPGALNTLDELAQALGDDANFAATVTSSLAGKVDNARAINTGSGLSGGGNLSSDRTISLDTASAADIRADSSTGVITPAKLWDALEFQPLTYGSTIAVDFDDAQNFFVQLSGNATLLNPTNVKPGQSGVIIVQQDGTGGRTMSFGSTWEHPSGVAPTLSGGALDFDWLFYKAYTSSKIAITALNNVV